MKDEINDFQDDSWGEILNQQQNEEDTDMARFHNEWVEWCQWQDKIDESN
jgi:hypothetical protein